MNNVRSLPVQHYSDGERVVKDESVAAETLIHITVNGERLVNLLGSPEDSVELAKGHLMTQFNIDFNDILSVDTSLVNGAVEVAVSIRAQSVLAQRDGIVTTSCGAFDQDQLDALTKGAPSVANPDRLFDLEHIIEHLNNLRSEQVGFQKTGGMHAAGLMDMNGKTIVMEDIGRHNAVDKAYGGWYQHANAPADVLLLSGRCGWDIVAKAAAMGTPIIASFGAASSLAAETARASNMTLISFVKGNKAVIIGPVEGRFQRKH